MNGLKQLFSRRSLAATVSTGLLMVSAIRAYAANYSVNAFSHTVTCGPSQQSCQGRDPGSQVMFYWCCGINDTCEPPPTQGACPGGDNLECGYCEANGGGVPPP